VKGLFNPVNGKIFLLHTYADRDKESTHNASYIRSEQENLKFETVKEENVSKRISTDDLVNILEVLGWNVEFGIKTM
jgi:hypothetical protein